MYSATNNTIIDKIEIHYYNSFLAGEQNMRRTPCLGSQTQTYSNAYCKYPKPLLNVNTFSFIFLLFFDQMQTRKRTASSVMYLNREMCCYSIQKAG